MKAWCAGGVCVACKADGDVQHNLGETPSLKGLNEAYGRWSAPRGAHRERRQGRHPAGGHSDAGDIRNH